jgi:hypothetical protein
MLVESLESGPADVEEVVSAPVHVPEKPVEQPPVAHLSPVVSDGDEDEEAMPVSPMSMQDGIRAVQSAINQAAAPPRWPMYVRQAKQFLRASIEGFDERKYGFASVVDLLRAAGKEGVLRIERDRQGAVRVFPGPNLASRPVRTVEPILDLDETADVEVPPEAVFVPAEAVVTEMPVVVDAEVVAGFAEAEEEPNGNVASGAKAKRTVRARKTAAPRAPRATKPRARKRAVPAGND